MALHESLNRVNPDLLRLLPPDARLIVEIGCGAGALGAQYKRINPHGRYVGVASSEEAAEMARERIDHVVPGNVETVDPADLGIEPGTIDCLVYSDILEHLVNPWGLLQRQASWLRPEGMVIACLPNVQHWSLLVRLLRGNWLYETEGLLDRDHLRFFALDGVGQLFSQAGLHIFDVQARNMVGTGNEFQQFQNLLAPVIQALGVDRDRFVQQTAAMQYIVRALRTPAQPRRIAAHTLICEEIVTPRVRVYEPNAFLNTIPGFQATSTVKSLNLAPVPGSMGKVFIMHRTVMGAGNTVQVARELLRQGYLVLAEMDDDPLRFPDHSANNMLTFRAVHGVQTSTEPLAEFFRRYNPNVAVFPNQIGYLPPPRQPAEKGSVRLFFGAVNREEDSKPILPALNRILREYGSRVEVQVIHDRQFFDALQTNAKVYEPYCAPSRYEELLHECDIALLPLEPNRFNKMKSDLKWIECAAHGVVTLASPTVYEGSIVPGETGFLYHSIQEFEERLRELIRNHDLRSRVAQKAYAWVKERRLQSQHYRTRYQWYLQMLDRLPQLNEELRRRAPELG